MNAKGVDFELRPHTEVNGPHTEVTGPQTKVREG